MRLLHVRKMGRRSVAVWFSLLIFLVWLPAGPLGAQDEAPSGEVIEQAVKMAYESFKNVTEGHNASYIPYLAHVDPKLFGIAIVTVTGQIHEIGDAGYPFAIESISKVFTLCRVMQDSGPETILEKIGVNATGFPFNSVLSVELHRERSVNPFVNAGAMAAVSLVEAKGKEERWNKIIGTMNDFAGRELPVNREVYHSESETNRHNRAIAELLRSDDRFYGDVAEILDLYTRQCSVQVSTRDLAVMGATLAGGGINPVTHRRVMDAKLIPRVLALMITNGLYENSGKWVFETGLPAKSGVGGGIVAVVPGRFAIAAFSPPLDASGNSVRAQKAIQYLSERLHANLFLPR